MPPKIYLVTEGYVQEFMRATLLEHHPQDAALLSREAYRRMARGILDRRAFPKPYYTAAQALELKRTHKDYLRSRVDVYLDRVVKIEIVAGTCIAINNQLASARNQLLEEADRT